MVFIFTIFTTLSAISQTIIDTPIMASSDDAEEEVASGTMDLTSSDLELCDDGGNQYVGLRFQNVTVPQGATITNAYIQFTTDETDTQAVTINIVGIDADDTTTFTTANNNVSDRIDGDISNATTATSSWTPAAWNTVGEQGVNQRTPDISAIVKELVDRGGWSSGNAMGFVFTNDSGTRERTAESYNGTDVAVLHVEYTVTYTEQEIHISGNGSEIINGQSTTSTTDDTEFGNTTVGSPVSHTFTIENPGISTLNLTGAPIVSISGDAAFTVATQPSASTISAGNSLTFVVQYNPTESGKNTATISIDSNDSDENPYTFDVTGSNLLITSGGSWNYLDDGSNQGTDGAGWSTVDTSVAPWETGNALFGYGTIDGGTIVTTVDYIDTSGAGGIQKNITTYFTKTINVSATDAAFNTLVMNAIRDDGMVVYVNGTEVWRDNITGSVAYTTTADGAIGGDDESAWITTSVANVLNVGANIIAVEIHQTSDTSSDISFDFEMYTEDQLLTAGGSWFYLDDGSDLDTDSSSWKTDNTHITNSWSSGNAQLGFGDGDELTVIADVNQITTYFRKTLTVDPADIASSNTTLIIEAIRDDGIVVYIDGVEVLRNNMPTGTIDYTTTAFGDVTNLATDRNFEDFWNVFKVANPFLTSGTHEIAVEIHQYNSTSDDISFDMKLYTNDDFSVVPTTKPDRDGDGVEDYLDADDDNDALPDIVEGCYTSLPETLETDGDGETSILSGLGAGIYTDLNDGNRITYSVDDESNFGSVTSYDAGEHGYGLRVGGSSTNGDLTLEFTNVVSNLFFKLIDFDENEIWTIDVYDENGDIVDLGTEEGIYHLGNYIEYLGANTISDIYAGSAPNANNPENRADDIYGGAYFYFPNINVKKIVFGVVQTGGTIRVAGVQYCSLDTDGDGIDDFYDSDSDNDGVPDIVEGGGTDINGDGKVDDFVDIDGDGVSEPYDSDPNTYFIEEAGKLLALDFDYDGTINRIDLDSDNDGIPDLIEAGGTDTDGDALIDGFTDVDDDGYHDPFDGAGSLIITGPDANDDGFPDNYPNRDPDGDNLPNFRDIDSDDDGIGDHTEAQATTATFIDYTTGDSDGDGILDVFDFTVGFGGIGLIPVDSELIPDGVPDYLDLDSDDDGESDLIEGHDTNGDDIIDPSDLASCLTSITAFTGEKTGVDIDQDGLDDGFDNNISMTAINYNPTNEGISPMNLPNIDDIATVERDWREPKLIYNFIDFDGVNDYIDFASGHDITSSFTVEAWVKQNPSSTGNGMILSKRDCNKGTNLGYSFGLVANQPNIRWYNDLGVEVLNLTSATSIGTDRWYYISATYDSASSTAKIYIDGIEVASDTSVSADPSSSDESFLIGAKFDDTDLTNKLSNKFYGWMDEIRVWDIALSETQIREMMNQEIELSGADNVQGKIIPKEISGLNWSNLIGYYPLNSIISGKLMDESSNTVDGTIRNITTTEPQTAPLPYTTIRGGNWDDATATTPWTYGDSVWDVPNTTGVDGTTEVVWNIVETSHNVGVDRNIYLLGLISQSSTSVTDEEITDSELTIGAAGGSHELNISSYLKLDGKIDLENESQLIQGEGSWLEENSSGYVERDQQGHNNSFTYNYWASPVSLRSTTANNVAYTIESILRNGTDSANPALINFCDGAYCADNATVNTSTYWLWKFATNQTNAYANWEWVGDNDDTVNVTQGTTLKGTHGTASLSDKQNYVFRGKPNNVLNGDTEIVHTTFPAAFDTNGNPRISLTGNPFPSALDADQFIDDNIDGAGTGAISGTLYFWQHWSDDTHNLAEYQGGYATYTKMGGLQAGIHPDIYQGGVTAGTATPGLYIPIAQGFYVEQRHDVAGDGTPTVAYGGDVVFKNSQRVFEIETANAESVFARGDANTTTTQSTSKNNSGINKQRIWLGFESPNGFYRQTLVGFIEGATDGIDRGYDGRAIEVLPNDAYFDLDDRNFGIVAYGEYNRDREIPINIYIEEVLEGETQKFMIDSLDNISDTVGIYIKDNTTEETFDLREETFEVALEAGTHEDRFSLVFRSQASYEEEEIEEEVEEEEENIEAYTGELIAFINNNTRNIDIRKRLELEIKEVYLINYLGQTIKVWNKDFEGEDISLPFNASTGSYILNIQTSEEIIIKKLIIK